LDRTRLPGKSLLNTKFNPLDRFVSQANKIRPIGTSGQVNRIVRIRRPSAERPLAAGEKISDNPVLIKIKIESIPHTFREVSYKRRPHRPEAGMSG